MSCKFIPIIFVIATTFVSAQVDSGKYSISIFSSAISIPSNFSQGLDIPYRFKTIFFGGQSAELDGHAKNILDYWSRIVEINPDAKIHLLGFCSELLDSAVDSAMCNKLSKSRSKAVYYYIAKKYPEIGERIIVGNSHNFKATFLDTPSVFDARVELTIKFGNFSPLKVKALRGKPYWDLRAFRVDSGLSSELSRIIARNPSAIVLINGFGLPNSGKSYARLFALSKMLAKFTGIHRRIALFVEPTSMSRVPYAVVSLVAADFSPAKVLWTEPSIPPNLILDFGTSLQQKFCVAIEPVMGFGHFVVPLNLRQSTIDLSEVPIADGYYCLEFFAQNNGLSSEPVRFGMQKTDSFSAVWNMDMWLFGQDKLSSADKVRFWYWAKAVANLENVASQAKVAIMVDKQNEDAAKKCWESLLAVVEYATGKKRSEIPRWFRKSHIEMEISLEERRHVEQSPLSVYELLGRKICKTRIEIIGK